MYGPAQLHREVYKSTTTPHHPEMSLIRTFSDVPRESAIERFHCNVLPTILDMKVFGGKLNVSVYKLLQLIIVHKCYQDSFDHASITVSAVLGSFIKLTMQPIGWYSS